MLYRLDIYYTTNHMLCQGDKALIVLGNYPFKTCKFPLKVSKDPIPWDKIDPEIRTLVRLLNDVPGIRTTSSCVGHPGEGGAADRLISGAIGFIVEDQESLRKLLDILDLRTATPQITLRANVYEMRSIRCECGYYSEADQIMYNLIIAGEPLYAQREMIDLLERRLSGRPVVTGSQR